MTRLQDRYGRTINYLRVSVTDRCNFRCRYCRPEEGLDLSGSRRILTLEEMFEVVRVAVDLGVDKCRLTGGEPLVRRGVLDLVRMLGTLDGLKDLAMTTNGSLLGKFALPLKEAGLHRVNVSLDTLDDEDFRLITRGGSLGQVLAGLEAARRAGLNPIKLNCVVQKSSQEPHAQAVARFAREHGYQARFIRQMDMAAGEFWVVDGGSGGDCPTCGRLRLTSTGDVLSCLFSDVSCNVMEYGYRRALELAVEHKPQSGRSSRHNRFYTVGG